MAEPLRPIELKVELPVPEVAAWRAISDPAEVAGWFAGVSALGAPGDPYEIDFGDGSRIDGIVSAIEPGRMFGYSWHWAGDAAAETTQVTWSVEAAGPGRSLVRLVHGGWSEAGLDADRRDEHESYWDEYLGALQDVVSVQEE